MPPGPSTNSRRTYTALPPRRQQRTFPHARRAVRRPNPTLPSLTKRQSTLTQLDFISATPNANRTTILDSSDDEDFQEQPPKKKQQIFKFNKKDDDQSTMTQFDRGEAPLSGRRSALAGSRKRELELGDWEEYSLRKWENVDGSKHASNDAPRLAGNSDDEGASGVQEIPETSQPVDTSSQPHEKKRLTEKRTPRKVPTRTEVPSSQTPPSTESSLRSVRFAEQIQRSPLKERDNNAHFRRAVVPETQNTSMKMLERVRFEARKAPVMTAASETAASPRKSQSSQPSPENSTTFSSQNGQGLKGVTTIQDSQPDDLSTFKHSPEQPSKQRPRKLRRTATIQDSQFEDVDLDYDDSLSLQNSGHSAENDTLEESQYVFPAENETEQESQFVRTHGDEKVEESQYIHDDYGPATFDPVCSALDRDAARYGLTQLSVINEEHEDSETDVEDLSILHGQEESQYPFSPAHDKGEDNESTPIAPTKPFTTGAKQGDEIIIASSPLLPRTSQAGTIAPTQISALSVPPAVLSPHANTHQEDNDFESQFPPPSSSSPHKHFSLSMPETISSSPLPLPPGGIVLQSEDYSLADRRSGTPVESLQDFSLPPPPPLSSSFGRRK